MKRIALTLVLLGALPALALASPGISVYKTSFSSRSEYAAMQKLAGNKKNCHRSWRKKSALGVVVKGGKEDCGLSTPVEGDAKQPDQIVEVVAKVTKGTDKKVAKDVYVGVAVRANRKENYELRVFPKTRRWQLLKSGEVLDENRDKKIQGLKKKNKLEISAINGTVVARANNKDLATFRDKDAEQVSGRKTALTYGDRKDTKKSVGEAFFDKLKVKVPVP
jgi:hypothetical protein